MKKSPKSLSDENSFRFMDLSYRTVKCSFSLPHSQDSCCSMHVFNDSTHSVEYRWADVCEIMLPFAFPLVKKHVQLCVNTVILTRAKASMIAPSTRASFRALTYVENPFGDILRMCHVNKPNS